MSQFSQYNPSLIQCHLIWPVFLLASQLELKDNKDKATGIDIYSKFIKTMIKDKSVEILDSECSPNPSSRADLR